MPTVNGLFPFLDPESLASAGPLGLVIVCAVIFAETGLLVGFVFPGDTLLLITGISAEQGLGISIWIAAPAIAVAAFLGGELGYYIGKKTGPRIFERRDSGFFSKEQVTRTYRFFDKYGALAVILARFVPIVRTLAPIAAGVGRMDYRRYSLYNAIGALAWGFGVTFLGYLIGFIPPVSEFVQHNIEFILLGAVVLTLIPTIYHVWKNHRAAKRDAASDRSSVSTD
ncbi:VTT domain-containing protein [Amnibacterium soli]|uniref:VTT domain-containing protein n=1 Tax=Amnibacterium soli TaxID=1282736 RepID=A0ABP8YSJ7_9MICO